MIRYGLEDSDKKYGITFDVSNYSNAYLVQLESSQEFRELVARQMSEQAELLGFHATERMEFFLKLRRQEESND